jgi:hypothetical protein
LGYQKQVFCRRDLLIEYRNGNAAPALSLIEQNESFVDWPFPLMYQEIFSRFGDRARYVLTKRASSADWLQSLKHHCLRTPPDEHCRTLAYGFDYPHGFEEFHLQFYERHNREVEVFFEMQRARHLLLDISWDAGDGWDKLCGFLGEPVPDVPFPHDNEGSTPIPEWIEQENRRRIELQLAG